MSGLIKRSFSLAGHRTSVALEAAFWDVLRATARARGIGLSALVAAVDAARDTTTPSGVGIAGDRPACGTGKAGRAAVAGNFDGPYRQLTFP